MKSKLVILVVLLSTILCSSANFNGWRWQEVEYYYDSTAPQGQLKVLKNYWTGDSINIFGKTYTKLLYKVTYQDSTDLHPSGIFQTDTVPIYFLREDTAGRVFIYVIYNSVESQLYDFSTWNVGDTLFMGNATHSDSMSTFEVITENNLDSILLKNGTYAQTVDFRKGQVLLGLTSKCPKLIKGIGFDCGFLYPLSNIHLGSYMGGMMVAFYKGDQLLWNNPDYVGLNRVTLANTLHAYSRNHRLFLEVPEVVERVNLYALNGALMETLVCDCNRFVESKELPSGVYLYAVFDKNGRMMAGNKILIP